MLVRSGRNLVYSEQKILSWNVSLVIRAILQIHSHLTSKGLKFYPDICLGVQETTQFSQDRLCSSWDSSLVPVTCITKIYFWANILSFTLQTSNYMKTETSHRIAICWQEKDTQNLSIQRYLNSNTAQASWQSRCAIWWWLASVVNKPTNKQWVYVKY